MVSVSVRSVDRGQVLAAGRDPIHQGVRLLDGDKGVDQDGVPLAVDEGRRYRRPQPLFRARRQVANDNRYAGRHEHVPVQKVIHVAPPRMKPHRSHGGRESGHATEPIMRLRRTSAPISSRFILDYRYNPHAPLDDVILIWLQVFLGGSMGYSKAEKTETHQRIV